MNNTPSEHAKSIDKETKLDKDTSPIGQLTNFRFSSIDEIRSAVENRSISILSNMDKNTFTKLATDNEKKADMFWSLFPIISLLILNIYALFIGNFYLLISIPLLFIGFLFSTHFSKVRDLAYLFSFFILFYFIYKSIPTGYFLSGSFLISLWSAMTIRNIYADVFSNAALNSQNSFVLMFKSGTIYIYDNKTKTILKPFRL